MDAITLNEIEAASRDPDARLSLFSRLWPVINAYQRSKMARHRRRSHTDDVLQQTAIATWQAPEGYLAAIDRWQADGKPRRKYTTYLYRLADRARSHYFSGLKVREDWQEPLLHDPVEITALAPELMDLETVMAELPAQDRELLSLRAGGMPVREVATKLQCVHHTVCCRERKIIAHLRERLEAGGYSSNHPPGPIQAAPRRPVAQREAGIWPEVVDYLNHHRGAASRLSEHLQVVVALVSRWRKTLPPPKYMAGIEAWYRQVTAA